MLLAGLHDMARLPGLAAPALAARLTGPLLGGLVGGAALRHATGAVAAWIAAYPAVRRAGGWPRLLAAAA